MKRLLCSLLAAASLFCLTSCTAQTPSVSSGSAPAESAGSAAGSGDGAASSSAPVQTNEERAEDMVFVLEKIRARRG